MLSTSSISTYDKDAVSTYVDGSILVGLIFSVNVYQILTQLL